MQPFDLLPHTNNASALKIAQLLGDGNVSEALDVATDVIDAYSGLDDAILFAAFAFKRAGKQVQAVELVLDALRGDEKRVEFLTLLGMCYRDLGKRTEAEKVLSEALSTDTTYQPARYQRAVVRQEQGHFGAASEDFAQYVISKQGSEHALAWSLFGVSLRKLERFEASARAIEKAIEIEPNDIPSRNALVITQYLAGNHQAAVIAGKAALCLKDRVASEAFRNLEPALKLEWRPVTFDPSDRTKNIISFSLWGDNPVYTHGAIVNAQIAPHLYPSWRCRFYCDETVPEDIRTELVRLGSDVVLVRDPEFKELKPLWRFLVSDDPKIDRFVCRDADSRLNAQEAVAVDEWIKSGQPFHIMRDHVYHMEVVLAGMWGGVAGILPRISELSDVANAYRRNRWNDQEFLRDIIWPLIRDHVWAHDSLYGFRGAREFPKTCILPGKIHVGGAIKKMSDWKDRSG